MDIRELDPLSTKGDQHQFSSNNIHTLSRDKVMRINQNDHWRENALIFYQILSTTSLKKCIEISLENWDLRGEAKAFLSDARQPEVDFLHFWAVFLSKFAGKSSL